MEIINYTFIIPHKNIPNLLRRCLNSIPRRDDIQIIVVDDNSNPDIVDFEYFPGIGEPCVEIYFTREGKGAGYARNVGLKHAKGRWLLFADADDFYLPNLLEILDEDQMKVADIIYYNADSVYSDTLQISCRSTSINRKIARYNAEDVNSINILKYTIYDAWMKMFSHKFILENNIHFEEVLSGNDVFFSVYSAFCSKSIFVNPEKIYCVTERRNSLSYSNNIQVLLSRIRVLHANNMFLKSHGLYKYRANMLPIFYSLLRKSISDFLLGMSNIQYNWKLLISDLFFFLCKKMRRLYGKD